MDKQLLIVSIITQIVTLLSVLTSLFIALFGRRVRAYVNRPQFKITIKNKLGVLTNTEDQISVRYYHINVANSKREISHNTSLVIKKIISASQGTCRELWEGTVCLKWMCTRQQEGETRNIGVTSYNCDLLCVQRCGIMFPLYIVPNNFPRFTNTPIDLIVTLQVLSDENVSDEISVRINWDGLWADGEKEMGQHCQISVLSREEVKGIIQKNK